MRKTKIVCTLGLASNTPEIIGQLMDAGMNVARFNFSHGTHESHQEMLNMVVAEREKRGIPVPALLDTKGPEIRLRLFKNDKEKLVAGDEFVLHSEEIEGTQHEATVSYAELYKDVKPGDMILLDDGLIELQVTKIEDKKIFTKILNGGPISNRKGVNVPGVTLSLPYMSEQDRSDILFGIKAGFDFIAASFVRCGADVLELRELLNQNGGSHIKIISKIENRDGVDNADEILRLSDGIMVARGDMGVEIPFEELPPLQKVLIKKGYQAGKIVITATQMLESMINNPRPTRAEVSDVANAVYDGTSAIMLSGESAAGAYPIKAVETMARIATRTELDINYARRFHDSTDALSRNDITNAISHATCATAYELDAKAIVTVTLSGRTARNISKYRPNTPIIGCTTSDIAYRQMAMSWGVVPVMLPMMNDMSELIDVSTARAEEMGFLKDGDIAIITTGMPLKMAGTTNLLKVHLAGDVLLRGHGITDKRVKAPVCVAKTEEEALANFKDGDILVVEKTTDRLIDLVKRAAGVVAEEDGTQSHAASLAVALDIPVLIGVAGATNVLAETPFIALDPQRGVITTAAPDEQPAK